MPGWIRSFWGRRGPHEWPARSPDPTPCDFFAMGVGKGGGVPGKGGGVPGKGGGVPGKGGGVPGKILHDGTIRGPDSERYRQRPT